MIQRAIVHTSWKLDSTSSGQKTGLLAGPWFVRRLMMPHPAAANPADVVQFCPNKSAAGVICNKPLDPKQHHMVADTEEVLTADMQPWRDELRIS